MDRRGFVRIAGVAAVSALVGCSRSADAPPASRAGSAEATPTPSASAARWLPIARLVTVSVAADPAADSYPSLTLGAAFDGNPATALLGAALRGLGKGAPVEYLRTLVREGGVVLVKPNWVEPGQWDRGKITHPALVLAMARLAARAVGPTGRVMVAEGTSNGGDLGTILKVTGFGSALRAANAARGPDSAPMEIVRPQRVAHARGAAG